MKHLKIAIGVTRGVIRLHGGNVKGGDIRSGSILLDGNWNAKISNIDGYVDLEKQNPDHYNIHLDVYSLGVILVEMLYGRLAWAEGCKDYSQSLAYLVDAHYYVHKNFDDMIFDGIKDQTDPQSLAIYQATAIECLQGNLTNYPSRYKVIRVLKQALMIQEDFEAWEPKLPINYKEIIPEYFGRNKEELYYQLHEGILFQDGINLRNPLNFFSIGDNGEGNEIISARKFSYKNPSLHKFRPVKGSRFSKVSKIFDSSNLNVHIKIRTLFLRPSANYKVYLIFRFSSSRKSHAKPMYVNLKYKMGNESLCAYFTTWREDGWMMIELFEFLCHKKDTDFEVLLESFSRSYCGRRSVYIEGIRFQEIRNASLNIFFVLRF
ncbi:putative F-box protein PP2-B12 [Bidens hawaiensis]|uniref:putative F-box protein PP2-B12 n=1 Tax=Bidens hawaiensis TaxID=980011 RepID=UPI00404954AB